MSWLSSHRGLAVGLAIGLIVAGIPAALLYIQTASLQTQNAELGRNLAGAKSSLASDARLIANDTGTIAALEASSGNLSAELHVLRGVANFSHASAFASGNLSIAHNRGYGWSVGGPYTGMDLPGYIAVVFRGGVANATRAPSGANVSIRFINKSTTWQIQNQLQVLLISYVPPMGGDISFTNDGIAMVWVNFQILYLN